MHSKICDSTVTRSLTKGLTSADEYGGIIVPTQLSDIKFFFTSNTYKAVR
jgi:hypothetical protein